MPIPFNHLWQLFRRCPHPSDDAASRCDRQAVDGLFRSTPPTPPFSPQCLLFPDLMFFLSNVIQELAPQSGFHHRD
jgi:hypothetical protein